MASSWSFCPGCILNRTEAAPLGSSSSGQGLPAWSKEFVCQQCSQQPWFECFQPGCLVPSHKNLFHTLKQLRNHAQHWHGTCHTNPICNSSNHVGDKIFQNSQEFNNSFEMDVLNDGHECEDQTSVDVSATFCFPNKGMAQFAEWCIAGDISQATQCLVLESLFQSPVSLYLDNSAKLPSHAVKLFLDIATLLIATGQTQHIVLANILSQLIDLIPPDLKEWPTMPTTLTGFQSHVLNPTNQHALVTILPIPKSYLLPDHAHAYCCLLDIVAFVLLFPRTLGEAPIPLRLRQLCQCKSMEALLLETPSIQSSKCLVTVGLLFWLDGWDPSASSKNNRSPVHTASATLLCIDNTTGRPFNSRTFPIACGPGKADHNAIFESLRLSLDQLSSGTDVVWSHHHGRWTTIQVHLIAFLMDQPERRGSNCLLGGNSKQHAMFGISCNFENLARPFTACSKCLAKATRYLKTGNFATQLKYACRNCYGFSLSRLLQLGKYKIPSYSKLSQDTPAYQLTNKPGALSFALLVDAWHYTIRRFVDDKQWTKDEVRDYFTLLCINKTTIDHFILCCCNHLLLQHIAEGPDKFDESMIAYVEKDKRRYPKLYQLPTPPAAWSIGFINQRVETIMHLSMNTQKAVFRLILHWAADLDQGPALKKYLQPLIESVQSLRVPFVPCRMFKNDKFGGFVAENYRAMTMLSPWLFRCLLENEFAPKVVTLASLDKPQAKWTVKENNGWLKVRGITLPANMPAVVRRSIVASYHNSPDGPPKLVADTSPTSSTIRELVVLLFRMFGTLFSTDLKDEKAGNRFEAIVVQFLVCVEKVGRGCHPNKTQPIWLSKYGMLGLLRCRQHFLDFTYLHSLYEGGIEGEGMVKELRPLCPNAVRSGWPLNLMNAYNRQNSLTSLTSGFQSETYVESPTACQHDANGKRYTSWSDVRHAIDNRDPVSLVVMGTESCWSCHVLVHMFRVTYAKEVILGGFEPHIDEVGFVYHNIRLSGKTTEYDSTKPVLSFSLMLPIKVEDDGQVLFCILDKGWRFVGTDEKWTILN